MSRALKVSMHSVVGNQAMACSRKGFRVELYYTTFSLVVGGRGTGKKSDISPFPSLSSIAVGGRERRMTWEFVMRHRPPLPYLFSFSLPSRPRLQRPAVEPGDQDVRAGDHGAPEEVRREHLRRRLPPDQALHRQRRRRRPGKGLCLRSSVGETRTLPAREKDVKFKKVWAGAFVEKQAKGKRSQG